MTVQFISEDQWAAIKGTVAALNGEEAQAGELSEPWKDLRDHWQTLLVAASGEARPFAVTEHFLALLKMFIEGAKEQATIGDGSQLVIDWSRGVLEASASFGLRPEFFSEKKCWVLTQRDAEKPD